MELSLYTPILEYTVLSHANIHINKIYWFTSGLGLGLALGVSFIEGW